MVGIATAYRIKKQCLQLFGQGTATAGADGAPIQFPNRQDFSRGAREKRLAAGNVTSNPVFPYSNLTRIINSK